MKYPTSDFISVIIHTTSSRVSMQKNITLRVRAQKLPATFSVSFRHPACSGHPDPFLHDSQTVMTERL